MVQIRGKTKIEDPKAAKTTTAAAATAKWPLFFNYLIHKLQTANWITWLNLKNILYFTKKKDGAVRLSQRFGVLLWRRVRRSSRRLMERATWCLGCRVGLQNCSSRWRETFVQLVTKSDKLALTLFGYSELWAIDTVTAKKIGGELTFKILDAHTSQP